MTHVPGPWGGGAWGARAWRVPAPRTPRIAGRLEVSHSGARRAWPVRQWLWPLGLLVSGLAGCKGAPPPLPPVPATAGPLLVSGGSPPPAASDQAVIDRVVGIVNEYAITMSELQEALVLYLRETKQPAPPPAELADLQRKVLVRMVNHRLQVQEARREKVDVPDTEVQAKVDDFVRQNGGDRARIEVQLKEQGLTWDGLRRDFRDQLLAQKVRSRRVSRAASVTEGEVDAYIQANRSKLEGDLKYHPRHIALLAEPPDAPAAWAEAQATAQTLVTRLREGADFAATARTSSKDGSAAAGGDLGWLSRGELQPLFEEAILKLQVGEVTDPIKSTVGYHLFRLEAREELTPEMLVQLRQQSRDLLLQKKVQERLDEWVESLRRRALIAERL